MVSQLQILHFSPPPQVSLHPGYWHFRKRNLYSWRTGPAQKTHALNHAVDYREHFGEDISDIPHVTQLKTVLALPLPETRRKKSI